MPQPSSLLLVKSLGFPTDCTKSSGDAKCPIDNLQIPMKVLENCGVEGLKKTSAKKI